MLKRDLLESFQHLQNIQKSGVLFSGGVDSSLAALLTERFCDKVILLTSYADGSRDSQRAPKSAEILNMKLLETQMSSESVWNTLPELMYVIESCNRMDVEIALPFFLSSKKAKSRGIQDVVSGQGPDELFAGYARYVEVYKKEGEEVLQKLLHEEVSRTYEKNIKRDEKAITYNGVAAHFPYLNTKFVNTALSIPINLKLDLNKTPSRKIIFRKLAIDMGLPSDLALNPKDATQYSSGSSKILIDSVREHILKKRSISRKKANIMVQDVLDIIAVEIGLLKPKLKNSELEIELEATNKFLRRIRSINHQQ
jgi:asparagine synthase (glutamine-hydrolysing)